MADSAFDELMGSLDYPMFVITVAQGDRRAGCLVGFATQASIDPPRFLACLSEQNLTFRLGREADHIAVHVLPAEARELAELFGGQTGDEVDKFARCEWEEGPHGLPILSACDSWFVGRVLHRRSFGDHTGFLLEPETVSHDGELHQLSFESVKDIEPGHDA